LTNTFKNFYFLIDNLYIEFNEKKKDIKMKKEILLSDVGFLLGVIGIVIAAINIFKGVLGFYGVFMPLLLGIVGFIIALEVHKRLNDDIVKAGLVVNPLAVVLALVQYII